MHTHNRSSSAVAAADAGKLVARIVFDQSPERRARDLASSEVFSLLLLRAFGLVCLIFVCCSSSANAGDMQTFSEEEEEEKKPTTTTTAKKENDVRYSQYMFMCF